MTNLKTAKEKYTPGTVFISAHSGDKGVVSDNPKFNQEYDGDIYVTVGCEDCDSGVTEMYVFFRGKWAEIKEPFINIPAENVDLHGSVTAKAIPTGRVKVDIPDHVVAKKYENNGGSEPEAPQQVEKLIRRFETGAVRSDATGRPRPDWISPYAIQAISMRMVGVQNDFGAANYLLGIPELACLESAARHFGELQEALLIEKDPVKAKEAAEGLGFNMIAMIHTMVLKEKGLYKKIYEEEEALIPVSEAKKAHTFTEKK